MVLAIVHKIRLLDNHPIELLSSRLAVNTAGDFGILVALYPSIDLACLVIVHKISSPLIS
jgi:hypothetical protein